MSTLTTILTNDSGATSLTEINANFSALNTDKIQDGVVSVGINKAKTAGIGVDIKVDGSTNTQGQRIEGHAASDLGNSSYVTGDAQVRFTQKADGTMAWGDGTNVADANFYRSAANTLKTDNKLIVGTVSTVAGSVTTVDGTQTLTNKRITSRVLSAASYTTDTGSSINGDTLDIFIVTAQAGALKFMNPSGTPTDGQKLILTVASSTTAARALTWDTAYGATTVALPTTTAATTVTLTMGFIYSTSKSLWQIVAVA